MWFLFCDGGRWDDFKKLCVKPPNRETNGCAGDVQFIGAYIHYVYDYYDMHDGLAVIIITCTVVGTIHKVQFIRV